jgi:hypothetical protein
MLTNKRVFEILRNIELNYDVTNFNKLGIDYWPVLKLLFDTFERNNKKIFIINRIIRYLTNKIFFEYPSKISYNNRNHFFKTNNDIDIIFAGANSHREIIEGFSLNKYFDTLEIPKNLNTIFIEYSSKIFNQKYLNNDKVYFLVKPYNYRNVNIQKIIFSNEELEVFDLLAGHLNVKSSELINTITNELINIKRWEIFFDNEIFKYCKPKLICVLCYYNKPMYGLLLAAKKNGITTLDFQHGGLGEYHSAYNFLKVPPNGYNTLPDNFALWDKNSYETIISWSKHTYHNAFVSGNPWIEYVKKNIKVNNFGSDKYILFTMTLGRDLMLPNYIIRAIKNNRFKWFLRFHPRTTNADKKWMIDKMKNLNLINFEIDISNKTPLPILLIKCWAHVSQSSGSLFEASILGVERNIVTEELGYNFCKHLVINGNIKYFNDHSYCLNNFIDEISSINKNMKETESNSIISIFNFIK